MANAPKPISLTQIDEGEYDGPRAPQPFLVVGEMPGGGDTFDLTALDGYDEGETQTLKNVSGVLTWVTDAE